MTSRAAQTKDLPQIPRSRINQKTYRKSPIRPLTARKSTLTTDRQKSANIRQIIN
jgi:hypothetical protein